MCVQKKIITLKCRCFRNLNVCVYVLLNSVFMASQNDYFRMKLKAKGRYVIFFLI